MKTSHVEKTKLPHRALTIAVVGLGYVGLPLALRALERGYGVIGIDKDVERVKGVNVKDLGPNHDRIVARALSKSTLVATTKMSAVHRADIILICVPTPVQGGHHMPDLRPLKDASEGVAKYLRRGQLVILESTVNPGITESVLQEILEERSGLKGGKDFALAHCPERINPGDKKWDVGKIPRVVGSLEPHGLARALSFYESIVDAPIRPMKSLKEAEAVKVVENAFRDINIAFVNELAVSFSRLGIDIVNVIDGAKTKPFSFLAHYPGCGVGGHCIPVDPYYLIQYARENGFEHKFLQLARRINNGMPSFTVDLMRSALRKSGSVNNELQGKKIAVLGLAYKPDIDDGRESPSYAIIALLESAGAHVVSYDPYIPSRSTAKSLNEALEGADGVILATAHTAFLEQLSPQLLRKHKIKAIVDGRNALDKASFDEARITYFGIGRGPKPELIPSSYHRNETVRRPSQHAKSVARVRVLRPRSQNDDA